MMKRFSFSKANIAFVALLLSTSTENVLAMIDDATETTRRTTITYRPGTQIVEEGSTVLGGLLYRGTDRVIRDGGEITIDTIERSVTRVPPPELVVVPLDLDDDVNLGRVDIHFKRMQMAAK